MSQKTTDQRTNQLGNGTNNMIKTRQHIPGIVMTVVLSSKKMKMLSER